MNQSIRKKMAVILAMALLLQIPTGTGSGRVYAGELPAEAEALQLDETEEASEAESSEVAVETTKETTASETAEAIPNLDYIKGRPLTEAEIERQQALEPDSLTVNPEIKAPEAEDLALDHVELAGDVLSVGTLPVSYDARSNLKWITSVKNQLPWGTCWAFGAVSSAETSLIRKGLASSSLDLSELQLVYFFYHPETDALGNTEGDTSAAMGSTGFLDRGGHGIFSTFCMASWTGLVNEASVPYSSASAGMSLNSSLCRDSDAVHMQNSYWVKMTDLEAVKLLLRECGNLSVSFYWDSNCHNYETAAYYNSASTRTNHSVNIVGWDDSYSRENFAEQPSSDGAWLVKNNWGTGWGDGGYFWISYEEASFTGNAAFGYVYDFEKADNYDHIYQYDGSWSYSTRSVPSGTSVANVFTVDGSSYQTVEAVSIALYNTNTSYSIQIYRNPEDEDPASGTPMLTEPQTGSIAYAGYVTIPLEQDDLVLARGDRYSVVFTLYENGDSVRILQDSTGTNGSWIRFVNDTAPGQSYLNTNGTWQDLGCSSTGSSLGTSGKTIRIKAFTTDVDRTDVTPTGIELEKDALEIEVGSSETLTAAIVPITAEGEILWTSSKPSIVSVENGVITAHGTGTVTITAEVNGFKASCTVTARLSAPANLTATAKEYRVIQVDWEPVDGAASYRVMRKSPAGKWKTIRILNGQTKHRYLDKVPSPTTTYAYRVIAYPKKYGNGVKGFYDEDGVEEDTIPDQPNLIRTESVDNGIQLTWAPVHCKGYRIYRKTPGGKWKIITRVGGSKDTCIDRTAKRGVEYLYSVRAYYRYGSRYSLSTYDTEGMSGSRDMLQ